MLTKQEVKHIANLARIGITEEEIKKYQKDLSSVLDYFEKLKEIDTEKIEPVNHITGKKNVYRNQDLSVDFSEKGKKKIIKNIPQIKDGKIKVKAVLE